jgi:hypothetical protein
MTNATITKLTADMSNHGSARLIIDGRKVTVASIHSYGVYCGETVEQIIAAYDKATKLHHPKVWVNLCSIVICGDAGFYDREAAKWADAPEVSVGDVIEFENAQYTIKPAHNKNYSLVAA